MRFLHLLVTILVYCSLGGCSASGLHLYPLTGTVSLDGQPLSPQEGETAFVELAADKSAGNESTHLPRGIIQADGTYTVTTAAMPGVPVGAWIVRVVYQRPATAKEAGKNPYAPPVSKIPRRFSDFGKCEFKVTTQAEVNNAPELKLTTK